MFRTFVSILAASVVLSAQTIAAPQRIAGVPPSTWSIGDGGPATGALLTPSALTWDRSGNLLIADWRNQRIRRLMADGTISTVISNVVNGVYVMAVDSQGNLYASVSPASVTDQAHIFEWAPNGSMTEIQSPGSMDVSPGIAIDAADNLYITDNAFGTGGFVWKRSPSGAVVKIAGSGAGGIAGNSGPALQVTLGGPHALTFDSAGNLLIVDFSGILRLNPDGTLTRFVQDWEPLKAAAAPDGSVYFFSDYYGIQRWTAAGGVVQFAGTEQESFSDGCALSGGQRVAKYASMSPADLAVDGAGRLYFADDFIDSGDPGWFYSDIQGRIRRIDPDGSIRTVAGSGSMPRNPRPEGWRCRPSFIIRKLWR
jgi:sugar lactone lactonase YvrE